MQPLGFYYNQKNCHKNITKLQNQSSSPVELNIRTRLCLENWLSRHLKVHKVTLAS